MADVSQLAMALAAMMKQPPAQPPPMMADQGLGSVNFTDLAQHPNPPPGAIQEINPGRTWGGRDRNNMSDFDVQMYRTYGIPMQQENL